MESIKEEFNRYKWVLLAGLIVAVLIGLITANLHVLQFMTYKMQGNTTGIISILEDSVKNSDAQADWYFSQGIEYLLKQKEMSEESRQFFETYFERFTSEKKLEVIEGYNKKNLFIPTTDVLMQTLMENLDHSSIQNYIKRMETSDLEQGLVMYYGAVAKVDTTFIDHMYKILSIYPKTLPFEKFQFDLYPILALTGEENELKKATIFSKLNPENAKENIFKSLKGQSIEGEQLRVWVEFLNKTQILDDGTYTKFNNLYSEIYLVRNQYKELDTREVDLKNKKEAVEVQIEQSLKDIESKQGELATLNNEISGIDSQLGDLTDSAYMALYIEKSSGTGNNEYEASIPKKGIFGNYKPSGQKYIVKLSETSFLSEGVYYVDIYLKGTKVNNKGNEYPYYVEVSSRDLSDIATLQGERSQKVEVRTALQQTINQLEDEVSAIKEKMGYDDNQEALKGIAVERDNLTKKLNEKVVEIKTLFGLGDLKITVETEDSKTE